MTMSSKNNNSTTLWVTAAAAATTTLVASIVWQSYQHSKRREERSQWIVAEIDAQDEARQQDKVLPSIISEFFHFELSYGATVEEANKKRTQKYYQMARDAHKYDLVPAIRSYPRLRNRREAELKRIFRYKGAHKSHRTVIVMLDIVTRELLGKARTEILQPLQYSHDITTTKVWIPEANVLPTEHLHVTIALPWWWHGIREGNYQLSQELVARFRQALVLEFHFAFQLELERIVLLGGKTLVALWRCVGEREAPDGMTIFDRHGEGQDPVVKLRRDIVQCFTSENNAWGQQPLTYTHRHYSDGDAGAGAAVDTPSKAPEKQHNNNTLSEEPEPVAEPAKRRNTIELKTPGLGDHDGFIHTTLARLPIDCLSMTDVELEPIHRLCREATATYCGHRMVVNKFRFVETTGEGGESNPCVLPIFDEIVQAPPRVEVGITGDVQQTMDLHAAKIVDRSATIGNLPPSHTVQPSMEGLFDNPAAELMESIRESDSNNGVNTETIESVAEATGLTPIHAK